MFLQNKPNPTEKSLQGAGGVGIEVGQAAMSVIRISRVNQTCERNPSQWEGLTDDGTHIYVRYRWGCLSIGSGKTIDEAVANANNVFEKSFGNKRDGRLEYAKLREVTAGVIDWPEQRL